MYNLRKFCNILAALRKDRSWTQTYLAEQLMVSPQAVSKWECGIGYPDITLFPVIAQLFDVPIGILFGERYELSKKGPAMTEYTVKYPDFRNFNIYLGNICRVEIMDNIANECCIAVKGDPIFLEYFSVEAENDTLVVRIKNPCGSDVHWESYDRCGYNGDNLVQIYTAAPSDTVNICVINYLDLCCSDNISPQGNLEYICTKESEHF